MASQVLLERAIQRAVAAPLAEARGAEGGARFPCPKDITGNPFHVCIYDGTGEASEVYMAPRQPESMAYREEKELGVSAHYVDENGVLDVDLLIEASFALQAKNKRRADTRAIANARRFCVRWQLTKLWTFTFKDEHWEKEVVKAKMNDFMTRWRVLNGGKPFPYLYVLEYHPGGHGLHVHVAVHGDLFTDFFALRRCWGWGRIRFDKNHRRSGEVRDDARRLAFYLIKYLVKGFDDQHELGEHRYETAQNFAVTVTRRWFSSHQEARAFLSERVNGERFVEVWSDFELEKWDGPPVWLYRSD